MVGVFSAWLENVSNQCILITNLMPRVSTTAKMNYAIIMNQYQIFEANSIFSQNISYNTFESYRNASYGTD